MVKSKPTAIARKLRKSIGEQTFCQRNGDTVVKMKIDENKSNTPLQQQQRTRWKTLSDLEQLFDTVSAIGFPGRPRQLTYHNAFMRVNLPAVSVDETAGASVDYARVLCAQGRLAAPKVTVQYDAESRQLTFSHDAEGNGRGKREDDKLYAAVVEKEAGETEVVELGVRSGGEAASFSLPVGWKREELEVYAFALSGDGRKASNSKHLALE